MNRNVPPQAQYAVCAVARAREWITDLRRPQPLAHQYRRLLIVQHRSGKRTRPNAVSIWKTTRQPAPRIARKTGGIWRGRSTPNE